MGDFTFKRVLVWKPYIFLCFANFGRTTGFGGVSGHDVWGGDSFGGRVEWRVEVG